LTVCAAIALRRVWPVGRAVTTNVTMTPNCALHEVGKRCASIDAAGGFARGRA